LVRTFSQKVQMVKSRLNPLINYAESRRIDDNDHNYEASLYTINLFDKKISIAIGQLKDTYQKEYGIVYYPIYLVQNKKTVLQLGIFEVPETKLVNIIDEDGDLDLDEIGDPLIYSFINNNREALTKRMRVIATNSSDSDSDSSSSSSSESSFPASASASNNSTKQWEESRQKARDKIAMIEKMRQDKAEASINKIDKEKREAEIAVIAKDIIDGKYAPMKQQSKEDAENEEKEFKSDVDSTWIENYMKSNNYNLVDNEGGGNCLFAVIRDGLVRIDKKLSIKSLNVKDLRDKVANEATEAIFQNYKKFYDDFRDESMKNSAETVELIKKMRKLKSELGTSTDRSKHLAVLKEAPAIKADIDRLNAQKRVLNGLMDEYRFMKNITTLAEFKALIQTCEFWAETWAISTLERLLNIKLIIFSEEQYDAGDTNNVIQCGQLNDTVLETAGKFEPDYYILVDYNGSHYKLITWKKRGALEFKELPYKVKELVADKCMERQAGPFYLIPDFKDFNNSLKQPEAELIQGILLKDEVVNQVINDENVDFEADKSLFDDDIVFQFYSKSNDKPLPGKGNGEKIPPDKVKDFTELSQIVSWRKKLSNFWDETEMQIDGKKWKSVEHYYQASKFLEGNPEFYAQFAIDSGSELSKDVAMATAAGGKTGRLGAIVLRAKNITMDNDFEKKREAIIEKAQYIKFTENAGLKQLLKLTGKAKLLHYRRAAEPEIFYTLMKIRNKI